MTLLLAFLLPLSATGVPAAPRSAVPGPAPVRTVSACRILTRAEIGLALGRRMSEGEEETDGPESTCDYASGEARVSIVVQRLEQKLDLRAEIASLLAAIPEGKLRQGPEMGGAALFLDIGTAGTQLHLVDGSRYLMISILGFGDPSRVSQAAETLARMALARLSSRLGSSAANPSLPESPWYKPPFHGMGR